VHGTASQPLWWAEMWNTLRADRALRQRFQFWVFIYNTGNPFTYSAANLRDGLAAEIAKHDPAGTDPALQQMVVIGHSQGGLLAKLTAADTGDRLLRAVTPDKFDFAALDAATQAQLRRLFVFAPLPFVKHVVFISTPHRGSYRIGSLALWLAHRFIGLPGDILSLGEKTVTVWQSQKLPDELRGRIPTSLDTMSPKNPLLRALAEIPMAPGVAVHSIIPVKSPTHLAELRAGHPAPKAADGVVKYSSAHMDGVPEFLVNDSHSCQANPRVIEEVRRILLEHLRSIGSPPTVTQPAP